MFDARDAADAAPVAIVNETLARQQWPNQNPLGRRIRLPQTDATLEVVGVVKGGKYILLREAPRTMLFRPLAQATPSSATLELVTAGAPTDVSHLSHRRAVRRRLRRPGTGPGIGRALRGRR